MVEKNIASDGASCGVALRPAVLLWRMHEKLAESNVTPHY